MSFETFYSPCQIMKNSKLEQKRTPLRDQLKQLDIAEADIHAMECKVRPTETIVEFNIRQGNALGTINDQRDKIWSKYYAQASKKCHEATECHSERCVGGRNRNCCVDSPRWFYRDGLPTYPHRWIGGLYQRLSSNNSDPY